MRIVAWRRTGAFRRSTEASGSRICGAATVEAAAPPTSETWAKEDVYFRLEDEIELLRSAGFSVDVPWRRDSFAVVVGAKR